MEFHRRKLEKIHRQFCFLCSCLRNKISKNTDVSLRARADYLIFRPQGKANNNYFLEQLKMTKTPKLLGKTTSMRKGDFVLQARKSQEKKNWQQEIAPSYTSLR